MNKISLDELKERNYNKTGISNYRLIEGICVKCCSKFEYSNVDKFLRNRINKIDKKHLWDTCSKCWLTINTAHEPLWIERNRQAQFVAQNKPEQKAKNAAGVSKSWTKQRKEKASKILKDKWKNDEAFAKKCLINISWTDNKDENFHRLMKISIGSGGLKGEYLSIRYDSALELSFLLYCEENNIKVKRFNLNPIKYIAEDNVSRLYFPDFIINEDTIIEIKGLGLYYNKNLERNLLKLKYIKEWTYKNNYKFRLLLSNDKILSKNYKRARKLHYENNKKNNNKI